MPLCILSNLLIFCCCSPSTCDPGCHTNRAEEHPTIRVSQVTHPVGCSCNHFGHVSIFLESGAHYRKQCFRSGVFAHKT